MILCMQFVKGAENVVYFLSEDGRCVTNYSAEVWCSVGQ